MRLISVSNPRESTDSTEVIQGKANLWPVKAIAKGSQSPGRGIPCEPAYGSASELELVSSAKFGNHAAFLELCRRYSTSLKWRLQRIVRNHEDAEDLLQDTLLCAYNHLAGFRGNCSFRTWITTIAINNGLMLLRKRKTRRETGVGLIAADGEEFESFDPPDPHPNPEQLYANGQANRMAIEAVKMLPSGLRIIVELCYRDGFKLADAANSIGITQAAAKSRLLRARKALCHHRKSPR